MRIEPTEIPDVKIVTPRLHRDDRGLFAETYHRQLFAAAGIEAEFVQDNQSCNTRRGVLRGLHFQVPPCPQGKLVRVVRGAILDVAVDIRHGSPTFGRHVAVTLSAENWRQLWVPEGFAHGFCTLEDATDVLYKVTAHYSPECDRGLAFDDPALAIAWPLAAGETKLSEKDRLLPRLADLPAYFRYELERA